MVMEVFVSILAWILDGLLPWSMMVSLSLWWGRNTISFRPARLMVLILIGVTQDIAMVGYLGITSSLLVSLMTVTWLISRSYQNKQLWWWYLLGIVGEVMMMVINQSGFRMIALGMQLVCLGLIDWWSNRFQKHDEIYVKP